MGFSYDWRRELATCDPAYYRWEQHFFVAMLERGLAYRRKSVVNWCERCQTVLANEQVEDGKCWRCESTVRERELEQWFLRITAYADELLAGCDELAGWPEKVLVMQRHLDRPQRRCRAAVSARRPRRGDSCVHDASRHRVRRDVRESRRRASAGDRALARHAVTKPPWMRSSARCGLRRPSSVPKGRTASSSVPGAAIRSPASGYRFTPRASS